MRTSERYVSKADFTSYGFADQCVQDGSAEALKELDESISKVNAEIEHMAPNLKAMDRSVLSIMNCYMRHADAAYISG